MEEKVGLVQWAIGDEESFLLWTMDYGLWSMDHGRESRFSTVGHWRRRKFFAMDHGRERRFGAMGHWRRRKFLLWTMDYGLWSIVHGLLTQPEIFPWMREYDIL